MIEGAAKHTSLFDLWLVSHRVRRAVDERLADTGLSGDDFAMYSLCVVQGPTTPTRLAQWVGMRPSTLTAYISRMDARGHLKRIPNPADGRSFLVELTPEGREAFERASANYLTLVADVERHLPIPVDSLRQAIAQLDRAVQAAGQKPA
ncbi:MAG: winged helix DNA-binding protein [Phenylobacterium sp.]|uniref:MarR family winged helix-turn-helix transcriptional regulator n=1 Tax=Phenylobacterium sp. TaxID=1871053 RepID=UPI002735D0C6|nr:winged helix DNA-binding protein [Phenylobacterium sp.]MDP3747506.1 winged helix DNA-binding protein [Phenylobacterium sp.]